MSDEPTERDVDALARVLSGAAPKFAALAATTHMQQARDLLRSDWYADRIAEARRKGTAAVEARVMEVVSGHERTTPTASLSQIDAGIRAADRAWATELRATLRGDA